LVGISDKRLNKLTMDSLAGKQEIKFCSKNERDQGALMLMNKSCRAA